MSSLRMDVYVFFASTADGSVVSPSLYAVDVRIVEISIANIHSHQMDTCMPDHITIEVSQM